ncbi:MAG: glycoside hydrolase family 3 C-terminal domain-containing protein, partial [Acidobacteriota bacterium]
AARQGIVLLKNEAGLLPLRKQGQKIAVIGPNADNGRNQLGDYTPTVILQELVTVLAGIRSAVGTSSEVSYVKGCDVIGDETDEIQEAVQAADDADVAIVVVGENERWAPNNTGTNGEGKDVASLDLTGRQLELVQKVVATGTPTVVVLINGRPLSIGWIAEHVPAIIEAWNCGEQGGAAVADVLFGDYNPGGRLPVTIPRHVGQLPVYYNHTPSRARANWGRGYVDMPGSPLYAFGYGLTYTQFEYSDLEVTPSVVGPEGAVTVSFNLKNTGERAGVEVAQLYIDDVISSITTPVMELRGFRRVSLDPGETSRVVFRLNPKDLSLLNEHLERVVELGQFEVMVGAASDDIRLRAMFDVKE